MIETLVNVLSQKKDLYPSSVTSTSTPNPFPYKGKGSDSSSNSVFHLRENNFLRSLRCLYPSSVTSTSTPDPFPYKGKGSDNSSNSVFHLRENNFLRSLKRLYSSQSYVRSREYFLIFVYRWLRSMPRDSAVAEIFHSWASSWWVMNAASDRSLNSWNSVAP